MAVEFLGLFFCLSLHSFPPFESGLKVWYLFSLDFLAFSLAFFHDMDFFFLFVFVID